MNRETYADCLACVAELEEHAARHSGLEVIFAPWCRLCAGAAELLNAPDAFSRGTEPLTDATFSERADHVGG